ncbi:adenosylcobinamide-phosphate synthase CbiB [Pseudoflavonifractor phocaeensis]|uniref:adenosylcobinamide-phosphate synthase CbiB n=1 Tax=Pseudoflavonifractor phocaeensis TaxID=1870988 RepID=UPI0025A46C8F|nr:adenosylcobinamide-phosphate synthase CbiB [Pseudoflavonifractor phocaeensis]MDM8238825.1 adenosylcobinamide-phosphate synthase CbiB [Pseudoflavonifractor phocaeensis]
MSHYFWTVLLPTVALDLLLGDPHWMPHPVRWMGRTISGLETLLRRLFPKTPGGERWAGVVLALALPTLFGGGSALILWGLGQVSPWLSWVVQLWFSYQLLAARSLQKESMAVYSPLKAHDLEGARRAVSRIVGRDTQALDETGVAKAAVETVAENTCDGVIAPLIFLFLGGLPAGMAYKAVSTLDSMVGYKNDKYRFFGWASARLDDILNFIPARLSGLLLCLGAALLPGCSGRRAWTIFWRDRRKHASPNSAHTEAACAGALGVRLAGDASYFGKVVHKPTLGDPVRPVESEDIPRACRLMYAGAGLLLLLFAVLSVWL